MFIQTVNPVTPSLGDKVKAIEAYDKVTILLSPTVSFTDATKPIGVLTEYAKQISDCTLLTHIMSYKDIAFKNHVLTKDF